MKIHDNDMQENTSSIKLPIQSNSREAIKDILDDQIVSTQRGGYQNFLVKWKNKPVSDCCWLKAEEV